MDKYFMEKAYEQASKSFCMRTKVGCVIVKDNEIISQGYNNTTGGIQDCTKLGCIRDELHIPHGEKREVCRAICAEQLAITEAARNGISLNGSSIYVTTRPCFICSKMIVSSGIKEIVYDKDYPDKLAIDYLKEVGINVRKI